MRGEAFISKCNFIAICSSVNSFGSALESSSSSSSDFNACVVERSRFVDSFFFFFSVVAVAVLSDEELIFRGPFLLFVDADAPPFSLSLLPPSTSYRSSLTISNALPNNRGSRSAVRTYASPARRAFLLPKSVGECATSRSTHAKRFRGGSVCTSAEAYKKSIAIRTIRRRNFRRHPRFSAPPSRTSRGVVSAILAASRDAKRARRVRISLGERSRVASSVLRGDGECGVGGPIARRRRQRTAATCNNALDDERERTVSSLCVYYIVFGTSSVWETVKSFRNRFI